MGRRSPPAAGGWATALVLFFLPLTHLAAPAAPALRIVFGGDVILGRHHIAMWSEGRLPSLLSGVRQAIQPADFIVVNLEGCLSERGKRAEKEYTFRAPPPMAKLLAQDGVDVVNLANNHSCDFGPDALLDTLFYLKRWNIRTVGAGRNRKEAFTPVALEKNGVRVLLFGLTEIVPVGFEAGDARPGVAALRGNWKRRIASQMKADPRPFSAIIAFIHWGTEAVFEPDQRQRRVLAQLRELGFTVVIGHHPHRVQGVRRLSDCLVFYSLGNLVHTADSFWGRRGLLVELRIARNGVIGGSLIPIVLSGGLPYIAEGKEKLAVLERIRSLSLSFSGLMRDDGSFVIP